MKTIALHDAVAMIPDGASLMIGGFMAVGTPERVIDELVRHGDAWQGCWQGGERGPDQQDDR
jgi:acyl CoA:acetate/3-ketoacid CoA transferase alpha subunit